MRVLILSDIHANLVALEAVLADAAPFGWDKVWCLGDVVGYGPEPTACVERIRALAPDVWVAGNHDWATVGRLDIEDFNPEARRAVLWTREHLSAEAWACLEALPDEPVVRGDFTITHGSPRYPIWEYILDPLTALANFSYFETPYCLVGHSHVPRLFRWQASRDEEGGEGGCVELAPVYDKRIALTGDHRLIINPGSVGQPRDSDPRACYALLDTEEMTWRFRRVRYSVEMTQARMRAAGLPERLINRLSFGW